MDNAGRDLSDLFSQHRGPGMLLPIWAKVFPSCVLQLRPGASQRKLTEM